VPHRTPRGPQPCAPIVHNRQIGKPRVDSGSLIVHLLRNSFRYASRKDWPAIAKDLKPVYTAPTEAAALDRFAEFAAAWETRYPAIVRL
jgi:transposase-like protein